VRRTLLAIAAALSCLAAAGDPAERLPDPAQEARAREMFKTLRCVVCQNESIDESNADIAADLRRTVRREIAAGRSDEQVRQYMVQRYGEFILLAPPFNAGNALLWLTPLLVLVAGGGYLLVQARRRSPAEAELTSEEEAALASIMADGATLPPRSDVNKSSAKTTT
jgi:cytochrome c-type biogenesis protein CcmH